MLVCTNHNKINGLLDHRPFDYVKFIISCFLSQIYTKFVTTLLLIIY
jgi:hypothetical protein